MIADVLMRVLLVSGLVAALGFVVVYSRASWRLTPVGTSVMLLSGSLSVLVIFGTVNALLGDYPAREWVRLAVYALMNVALWRQLIVLIKVQKGSYQDRWWAKREREAEDNPVTL